MDTSSPVHLTRARVKAAVLDAITDTLAIEKTDLTESTKIAEDLQADSMDVVTIMILLEEALDIDIDPGDLPETNTTIGWIVDQLVKRLQPTR